MSINRLLASAGVCFLSAASAASGQVTIAQLYGGSTNSTAAGAWRNDYVLLRNKTASPIDLTAGGYALSYAAATGNFSATTNRVVLSGTIPASGYFLVQLASTTLSGGQNLPITPDQSSTSINLSATTGKLMLVRNGFTSTVSCPIPSADIVDFVGYGTANCSETSPAAAPSTTTSLFRGDEGCTDSDNNSSDLAAGTAGAETFRNAASVGVPCVATDANVSVIINSDRLCEIQPGSLTGTFTVQVSNADGGLPATGAAAVISLPEQFVYATGTPSQGTVVVAGSQVNWTIGAIAPGASATLVYSVDASGTGPATTSVTVSANEPDSAPGNNTASRLNEVTAGILPLQRTFVSNHPSAPLSARQFSVPEGGTRTFSTATGSSDVFSRFNGSADGTRFTFVGNLDSTNTATDRVIFSGDASGANPTFTAVIQKGTTQLDDIDTVGATLDPIAAINNAGQIGFSGVAAPATTNNDYVSRRNADGSITTLVREGLPVPAGVVGPATWAGSNHVTGIDTAGGVSFFSTVAGGDVSGTTNESLVGVASTFENVIVAARKGVDQVDGSGVPLGDTATWKFFDSAAAFGFESGFFTTADGATWMAAGTINSSGTTTDNVLVRSGFSVAQEARELPAPAPFPGAVTASAFLHGWQMDSVGNWIAYGSNAGSSPNDWVIRNGQPYTKTGDPIFTGSSETWSDTAPLNPGGAGYADAFFGCYTTATDSLVFGVSTEADARRNGVAVWNNTRVIAREGDPIDVNQNGIDDDATFIDIFRNGRVWIDSQRRAYIVVSTRSSNGACGTPATNGHAVLLVQLPATVPVCLADIAGGGAGGLEPDGTVDGSDYVAFINSFAVSDPAVDALADIAGGGPGGLDPDGIIDGSDFVAFINAFAAGC